MNIVGGGLAGSVLASLLPGSTIYEKDRVGC
jgi:flavin-dependent dehydrogenase